MLSREEYIRISLESNLFWLRIMKEHAIFLESAIPPMFSPLAMEADHLKKVFEELLERTIKLANGFVSREALLSGENYTRFTYEAERIMQHFTGININRNLTYLETNIEPMTEKSIATNEKEQEVSLLNQNILTHMGHLVQFKTKLLNGQVSCQIVTFEYPAVIEHVIHEAHKYIEILNALQDMQMPMENEVDMPYGIPFWNERMEEHAKIIRGKLDPSEAELFHDADHFVHIYEALLEKELQNPDSNALSATIDFSGMKAYLTKGLIECKVKAVMMPLFTDHLLREANHYIRLLQQ